MVKSEQGGGGKKGEGQTGQCDPSEADRKGGKRERDGEMEEGGILRWMDLRAWLLNILY